MAAEFAISDIATGRILARISKPRPNFRGDLIPSSYGLMPLMFGVAAFLTLAAIGANRIPWTGWAAVCGGFGLLGLLDDIRGDGGYRGLRGHLRALVRDRRITTGLLKATGGGALALAAALIWCPHPRSQWLPHAGIIALGANTVNLLDLRPGRAGASFLAVSALVLGCGLAIGSSNGAAPLALIMFAALRVWLLDRRAKVMLGDTGSNLLGATAGFAVCQAGWPLAAQCGALAALVALNAAAERYSISGAIARSSALRWLDGLTGVR